MTDIVGKRYWYFALSLLVILPGMISLAVWVERHSGLVLKSEADVGPMIAVNRAIMEGLST